MAGVSSQSASSQAASNQPPSNQPGSNQPSSNQIELVVAGRKWTGWTGVRITRGIERMPNDFALQATEQAPGSAPITFQPFDTAVLTVGGETVITGYIDHVERVIGPRGHGVVVRGRGRCVDLVECSAKISTSQIGNATVTALITQIAGLFGIKVTASEPGELVRSFDINLTETPWSIIDRVARYGGFLAWEDADGNLVLGRPGAEKMASGFAYGVNIQQARQRLDSSRRYSEITTVITTVDSIWQMTPGGKPGISDGNVIALAKDPRVPRYRPLVVVSEQTQGDLSYAQKRADWEIARRYGRSQALSITTDSWRDSAGRLWQPGASVPIDLKPFGLPSKETTAWTISEVTFQFGADTGTVADLLLMPPQAFEVQPTLLYAFDRQVAADLARGPGSPPPDIKAQ